MKRAPLAFLGLGLAVMASQAGHLIAYQLRYGDAALQLQSTGAHAYFPALVKMGLGVTAAATLVGALIVGFARLAPGRPVAAGNVPRFMRLLSALFAAQLAVFLAQETLEAALGGTAFASPAALLLWGAFGQMPFAALAALALRWLLVEVRPALEQLSLRPGPTWEAAPQLVVISLSLIGGEVAISDEHLTASFNRRGPPS